MWIAFFRFKVKMKVKRKGGKGGGGGYTLERAYGKQKGVAEYDTTPRSTQSVNALAS